MKPAFILAMACVMGCSPSKAISNDATGIGREAEAVKVSAGVIQKEAAAIREEAKAIAASPGTEENAAAASRMHSAANTIESEAALIRGKADVVTKHVGNIHANVPGVQDVIPQWQKIMYAGIIVVGILAIVFVLWRTNALAFLGAFFAVVTPKKRQEASMLAKAVDPSTEETVRELAAAKLASDPALKKAFAEEQKKLDAERGRELRKEEQT